MPITTTPAARWDILPKDIVASIIAFEGSIKLRNGIWMTQISHDDPRRDIVNRHPKLAVYSDRDQHLHLPPHNCCEDKSRSASYYNYLMSNTSVVDSSDYQRKHPMYYPLNEKLFCIHSTIYTTALSAPEHYSGAGVDATRLPSRPRTLHKNVIYTLGHKSVRINIYSDGLAVVDGRR